MLLFFRASLTSIPEDLISFHSSEMLCKICAVYIYILEDIKKEI